MPELSSGFGAKEAADLLPTWPRRHVRLLGQDLWWESSASSPSRDRMKGKSRPNPYPIESETVLLSNGQVDLAGDKENGSGAVTGVVLGGQGPFLVIQAHGRNRSNQVCAGKYMIHAICN
mmetsp:Transcript_1659/g.10180  ORF Transcript_1659/g.10180 Transcript_1659/m.10180 type:complete len:120 (-) Transcript_1659:1519-1878(-)